MGFELLFLYMLGMLLAEVGIPLLILAIELALLLLQALWELLRLLFAGRREVAGSLTPSSSGFQSTRRVFLFATLGIFAATLIFALLANFVFFDRVVRFAADRAAPGDGITLKFEKAEGNLFSGRITLINLTLKRDKHEELPFTLKARRLELDFALLDLLRRRVTLERLMLSGLRGTVERKRRGPPKVPGSQRRPMVVRNLVVDDAQVRYVDRTTRKPVELTLIVDKLRCARLRTKLMYYDLLFASRIESRIDKASIVIATARKKAPNWEINQLPVQQLAPFLGEPFDWFVQGKLSISVDILLKASSDRRKLDTTVSFDDVKMRAPRRTRLIKRALARPLVALFNRKQRVFKARFSLVVDETTFEWANSLDRSGLTAAFARAFLLSLKERFVDKK